MTTPYPLHKNTFMRMKDQQQPTSHRASQPAKTGSDLLGFALLSLEVSARVMRIQPEVGPQQMGQPQVIAVLCLMCRENWSPTQAHHSLATNAGLRAALKLADLPDNADFCRLLLQSVQEKANIATLEMVKRILGYSNFSPSLTDRSA